VGYAAAKCYNPAVGDVWLTARGFSDGDARELAISGTSRHPVVGLLRSSQGTSITLADYDKILGLLRPGAVHTFAKLREVAKSLDHAIDAREPWESGYQLGRLIRERLSLGRSGYIDVESIMRQMDVVIEVATFGDSAILGACVGIRGYCPLVVLNNSCPDATGISGRRVTLAHEFCHLLFDRGRLRSLARFEGSGSESDRLIEMRANAFAIELLVPMATLVGTNGSVADENRLLEISLEQQVSLHALRPHAANLRNRLSGSG
jgi:Zn-dependent peptidase ImmA (M78 family)